jgi:hypothetical protein
MIGVLKPSLHFYTRQVVLYEGKSKSALVNLADRLSHEQRQGFQGIPLNDPNSSDTVLVVIDERTADRDHWQGLAPEILSRSGIYSLWRVDRSRLEQRSAALRARGVDLTWRDPRPERY